MGEVEDELEALRHIFLEDELQILKENGEYRLGMLNARHPVAVVGHGGSRN